MQNYLVFMSDGDEKVPRTFADAHYRVSDGLWAVGAPTKTCMEVCNALDIHARHTMVVAQMGEYYGRFDRALWQYLEAWSRT